MTDLMRPHAGEGSPAPYRSRPLSPRCAGISPGRWWSGAIWWKS